MGWRGPGDCRVCVRQSEHNEGVQFPRSVRLSAWVYEVARLRIHLYLRWIDLGERVVASWVDAQAPVERRSYCCCSFANQNLIGPTLPHRIAAPHARG
jgi:hypothetical protein